MLSYEKNHLDFAMLFWSLFQHYFFFSKWYFTVSTTLFRHWRFVYAIYCFVGWVRWYCIRANGNIIVGARWCYVFVVVHQTRVEPRDEETPGEARRTSTLVLFVEFGQDPIVKGSVGCHDPNIVTTKHNVLQILLHKGDRRVEPRPDLLLRRVRPLVTVVAAKTKSITTIHYSKK